MLRELESQLISIVSSSGGTLSRKNMEDIERVIDEYYGRWKA